MRRIARASRSEARPETLPVPLLVVHGGADDVVSPVNAAQLVRQYLALNGHPAADAGAGSCDNAFCFDIFDCAIFHFDKLNCNFTKCDGFVCKP